MAHRFFVETVSEETILTGEEFRHAKNVLRLTEGDEIVLLDNSGTEYDGIVSAVGNKELTVHVLRAYQGEREAKTPVRLLFGYLKNADRNEFIVQKAVELGVREIGVFSSEYSSSYMNENKLERLNKVSKEAAKQCLRSLAPQIVYYPTLEEALASAEGYENKLFACEFAEASDCAVRELTGSCALVVGSEGGFSSEEFAMAREMGFQGVTLGKRILRAETAAIAFASVVQFVLGELR
ncbi:MAG: RsmE family RNA methyltransferase [Christensenellaceae bacterium]